MNEYKKNNTHQLLSQTNFFSHWLFLSTTVCNLGYFYLQCCAAPSGRPRWKEGWSGASHRNARVEASVRRQLWLAQVVLLVVQFFKKNLHNIQIIFNFKKFKWNVIYSEKQKPQLFLYSYPTHHLIPRGVRLLPGNICTLRGIRLLSICRKNNEKWNCWAEGMHNFILMETAGFYSQRDRPLPAEDECSGASCGT